MSWTANNFISLTSLKLKNLTLDIATSLSPADPNY